MTAPATGVVVLGERDYRFGVGNVRLRIERIDWAHPVIYDGERWYPVVGVQLRHDGSEMGRRELLVHGRRLPGKP
jgi:hypothetical protein